MVWAFARIRKPIPAILLKELENRTPLATSELVASTWALAEMRVVNSIIWPSICESLKLFPNTSRSSSALLRAHAVIMVPPPSSLRKLDLRSTSPQTLANSLWALAKLQLPLSAEEVGSVLSYMKRKPCSFKPQEFSSCLWAMASMEDVDATVPVFQEVEIASFEGFEDHHLAQVAWAFASAGVRRSDVMDKLASEILLRHHLGLQAIANISWAWAVLDMKGRLHHALQEHLVSLAEKMLSTAGVHDVDSLLGLLWAHRKGCADFLSAVTGRLRKLGKDLDDSRRGAPSISRQPQAQEGIPRVVLQVPGVVVVFKPHDWEVDTVGDGGHEKALSSFSHMLGIGLGDVHGFISRLDTPSSGLILQATSFEGLYMLQAQRELGDLERDYVVLCWGWVPRDGEISFRLRKVGRTSVVSDHGRPALTRIKVLAHLSYLEQRVSFLAVRIESGRMHQIRSHLSHMGFPVFGDARYNKQRSQDVGWPGGHFLHRYRLTFTDLVGQRHVVTEPLPQRLRSFLAELQGEHCKGNLKPWLSASGVLESWEAVHRSWTPQESLQAKKL